MRTICNRVHLTWQQARVRRVSSLLWFFLSYKEYCDPTSQLPQQGSLVMVPDSQNGSLNGWLNAIWISFSWKCYISFLFRNDGEHPKAFGYAKVSAISCQEELFSHFSIIWTESDNSLPLSCPQLTEWSPNLNGFSEVMQLCPCNHQNMHRYTMNICQSKSARGNDWQRKVQRHHSARILGFTYWILGSTDGVGWERCICWHQWAGKERQVLAHLSEGFLWGSHPMVFRDHL